ncbi:3-oxoacyl-[acyl-carrier protein] reductase [Actinomycetales bacterium JB111]|nr:3-oxoacyl-[acyl-carrier protein] reductase [Actinomycetales bacterium JB111]
MNSSGPSTRPASDVPVRLAGEPLAGTIAVVTGGGQGIGRAFAHALAAAGGTVVVTDVVASRALSVADEIASSGHRSDSINMDVSSESSVSSAVAEIIERHGRIDTLLNNAALFSTLDMHAFEEIPLDEWNRVLDVNLTGTFLTCKAVSPHMRSRRCGSIINISSGTVLVGRPNYLHYVASKAAVVGMTRAMAREIGVAGVRVNAILPGSVDTGIERASAPSGSDEGILAPQSLKWRLTPHDITGAAVFLASDASRSMTGQSVVIDAGASFV